MFFQTITFQYVLLTVDIMNDLVWFLTELKLETNRKSQQRDKL